jgi:hypothetical protein
VPIRPAPISPITTGTAVSTVMLIVFRLDGTRAR